MEYQKICTLDDLWAGEMIGAEVDGHVIVVVNPEGGEPRAFRGVCPHQAIPLVEGKFDGRVLMCRAHQWTFDVNTGKGINPGDSRLRAYPAKIEGEDVLVAVGGVETLFAHS
ncbi:Rieske 2Fe-2S domain-containing protein [Paraburkholderia sp. CNPSo 3274]|uniref:2Fe-2S ferredoxin n=1 Tax=Paraburkholderia guartelaensis TaxID=2546446 RepID=A0A4R5L161_9BURK|nr:MULTISPECIES: Rieske 2Fe-2S domain-containing protein [Paraburkholderia]MCP3712497.1 Rieske 2Fe-2S domain-containing protein [Paraburkholderia sp. CNPSo 3274]MCP3721222.1 Rieske 2Fe-2S domain-containing protein [Paraburkholderia sp. CNPSo 3281]MCP3728736.1 Rieske 2Fe-2S domain-containing protein [Paraburkholderia sp. CNPSo 3272]MCX5545860.1 Rieske 2Fe-2S domain-containing protein [Paraburkholderia sp. CNPSo 3076]TDG02211.1 2Fe-2S ferredoxin [Paraburkholderia guartelaensis]